MSEEMVKYSPNLPIGTQGNLKALMNSDSVKEAIRDLAPKHLRPETLIRLILTAASRNPLLLQCTQSSILKGAIEASSLGLDCSGLLGRGYLIPYRNNRINAYEAQFQAGYLGLADLARRSGEVLNVRAKAVFEGDRFEYTEGLDRKLIHVPAMEPDQEQSQKTMRWVYAVATFANGYEEFVVLGKAEVERHRARSRAKDSGPWVTDYVAMAMKTAVRALCKFLPMSVDLQTALQHEITVDSDDIIESANLAAASTLEPTQGRQPSDFGFSGQEPGSPGEGEQQQQGSNEKAAAEGKQTLTCWRCKATVGRRVRRNSHHVCFPCAQLSDDEFDRDPNETPTSPPQGTGTQQGQAGPPKDEPPTEPGSAPAPTPDDQIPPDSLCVCEHSQKTSFGRMINGELG